MYIVVSQCYEMCFVFSQLFCIGVLIYSFEKWEKQPKVFPVSTAEKLQRGSFFARTFKKATHNWLITSCVTNEFEKIHESLYRALQIWLGNA